MEKKETQKIEQKTTRTTGHSWKQRD